MKTRWIQLIAGLAMFVLCISTCTTTINAAVVWSDDFETGLDGWTLYGYTDYINTTEWVKTEGNFSDADGTLKVLDDEVNIARHDSTVNGGTWSFDMFVPNDLYYDKSAFYVEIMSNGTYWWFGATNESWISIGYWNEKFIVWEWVGDDWEILSRIIVDPIEGWHHIDVTRTSGGFFEFYFDGVLPTLAVPLNFTNNDVTSSTYLQFYCENASGAAIDNLVVRNDIITITPPPPPLPWILIAVGGGVAIAVIVLAVVFLRRR